MGLVKRGGRLKPSPLRRGKPLNRRAILKRNPRRRRASRRLPGATGWTQRVFALYGTRCVVCGKRAAQGHHVVPRQVILGDTRKTREEREQLAYDARNGAPVCAEDHELHERAVKRIPRRRLPAGVIAWALEHGYRNRINDRRVYPPGEPKRSDTSDQKAEVA